MVKESNNSEKPTKETYARLGSGIGVSDPDDDSPDNVEATRTKSSKFVVSTTAMGKCDVERSKCLPQRIVSNYKFCTHGLYSKSTKFFICPWKLLRRKYCLILLSLALLTILHVKLVLQNDNSNGTDKPDALLHFTHVAGVKGYFVWSENCRMPYIDPYSTEIMKYFKREAYKPCSTLKPLSRVTYNAKAKQYILEIIEENISSFSFTPNFLYCCYQSIERHGNGDKADLDVNLSECTHFKGKVTLPSTIDNILVKCNVGSKQIYKNGHAMIPERQHIRERLAMWAEKDNCNNVNVKQQSQRRRPPNVLMIGIDSVSRINLIRAMPKTARFLHYNEWFEMSGYNKIADNTFPNFMAVLTGRNKTSIDKTCAPEIFRGLHNCTFIWDTFREHGYVTAYAEDDASINTFNYEKVGFEKPPVDYYLRPFFLGAEQHLPLQRRTGLVLCLGYKHSAEFVYDYAIEFAERFKNDPFFGLFWTNTFSHNSIGDTSAMDDLMVEYIKKFTTLNNTIVIFFSDHGMRFGPMRKTHSGHLEERLPFIFLSLPQYLKREHPEFVMALSMNKNRLTNPYDLHMTLKHVLALTKRVQNLDLLRPTDDCVRCQTLLEAVPHNRSCADIAIEDHWCTCIPYISFNKSSQTALKLAQFAIDHINGYVASFENASILCVPFTLHIVENAFSAEQRRPKGSHNSVETYRIVFRTKPNWALFEATILYSEVTETFEINGEVSRLSLYSMESKCVSNDDLKKYCLCKMEK